MSVNHEIVAAVPVTGSTEEVDKTLVRNWATARVPYVLHSVSEAPDLVAVDPVTGAAIMDLMLNGRVFHYDADDHSSDQDDTTCLVTADARRYKLSDGSEVAVYSVLDNTLTAPPDEPSFGDAHLIADAATGEWDGHEGDVGVWTARGYEFISFGIGRLLFVEANGGFFVHRKTDGSWEAGVGNLSIGASSVPLSAAINFGRRAIVENQTTTSPPETASVGTAYIIGPSATGDWAGKDGKLAICEVANTFTVYPPSNGWAAYDKSLNGEFRFNGTAWVSAVGAIIGRKSRSTAGGSHSSNGAAFGYTYNTTTAPTTSPRARIDQAGLVYQAAAGTNNLVFSYSADVVIGVGTSSQGLGSIVVGLFRDSENSAIAWSMAAISDFALAGGLYLSHLEHTFEISASDALPHTYGVRIVCKLTDANNFAEVSSIARRTFRVEESVG
jgi:hypothetical protein